MRRGLLTGVAVFAVLIALIVGGIVFANVYKGQEGDVALSPSDSVVKDRVVLTVILIFALVVVAGLIFVVLAKSKKGKGMKDLREKSLSENIEERV